LEEKRPAIGKIKATMVKGRRYPNWGEHSQWVRLLVESIRATRGNHLGDIIAAAMANRSITIITMMTE
jgi:hypothetical protein